MGFGDFGVWGQGLGFKGFGSGVGLGSGVWDWGLSDQRLKRLRGLGGIFLLGGCGIRYESKV